MPVIGFLNPTSPQTNIDRLQAFHRGLKHAGYVERENVAIEYRWAEGQLAKLPELASELVRRQVSIIVTTGGPPSALAAKNATSTIPIVFAVAIDPVTLGLVGNLARPDSNLTGISIFNTELTAKRFAILRDVIPSVRRVAVFVNPASKVNTVNTIKEVTEAARSIGVDFKTFEMSRSQEIDAAFDLLAKEPPEAIFVGNDGFFVTHRARIAELALRNKIPAIYASREIVEVGGLISYGTNIVESFFQSGDYAGRVLNGAKPADLPVLQSTRFELVINMKTARALGLAIPLALQVSADEVIE